MEKTFYFYVKDENGKYTKIYECVGDDRMEQPMIDAVCDILNADSISYDEVDEDEDIVEIAVSVFEKREKED